MDSLLTASERAFRDSFRAWLPGALAQHGPEPAGEAAVFGWHIEWERRLYAGGWAGLHWPAAYGGRGLGIVEQFLAMEELGAACAPEGANNIGRELVGPILLAAGTEAQKQRFVPRIVACQDIWCQGFSEPEAGSDLASVRTAARRDGAGWRIDGQKVWTTNAQYADWCLLLARTDPAAPRHKGLTLFLVPMVAPGLRVSPIPQITGKSTFNEVFLDAVKVGDDLRLGPVNEGWQVANRVLALERGTTRLYRRARFAAELRDLMRLAGDRVPPAAAGRLFARLEALRAHNLRLVVRVAEGQAIGPEASLQKLAWSELHLDMMRAAADWLGPDFLALPEAARFRALYLAAQAETIYAGSTEVQLSIIADRVLHLPKEGAA